MNERRYPAGYIPLTMHELGGVPRDVRMSNDDFHGGGDNDEQRDQRGSRKRFSRSRRDSGPRRNSNPRHVSRRDDFRGQSPDKGRLKFGRNERSRGDGDDF